MVKADPMEEKKPQKGKLSSFATWVCNCEEGKVMDRTPGSWGKILIFCLVSLSFSLLGLHFLPSAPLSSTVPSFHLHSVNFVH